MSLFCGKKPTLGALKLGRAPYRVKMTFVKTQGLQNAKEQARTHGFNAKNDKSYGALWLKIWAKMSRFYLYLRLGLSV